MKLVENKAEYLPQGEGFGELYEHVEKCGRICYKSEDKITKDSAEKFVNSLKDNGHLSVLEHGTVYIEEYHVNDGEPSVFEEIPYTI